MVARADLRALRKLVGALPAGPALEAMRAVLEAREAEYRFTLATGGNRPGPKPGRVRSAAALRRLAARDLAREARERWERRSRPETDLEALERLARAGFIRPAGPSDPLPRAPLPIGPAGLAAPALQRGFVTGQAVWPGPSGLERRGRLGRGGWGGRAEGSDLTAEREARAIWWLAEHAGWRRGRGGVKRGGDEAAAVSTPAMRRFRPAQPFSEPTRAWWDKPAARAAKPAGPARPDRLLERVARLAPEAAAILRAAGVRI